MGEERELERGGRGRREMPPHPVLNAMLICDQTFQDEQSGKMTLVGVFETVRAYQFPARHGRLCVYAKLADVQGEYRLRLELVQLEELKIVGQGQFSATFSDRMTPVELSFQVLDTVFERAGRYEFRLYANDRWVGSKTLTVAPASEARMQAELIRVYGSAVNVRWLSFMLPSPRPAID
ncbi:MAG: hypothetical protein ACE147_13740 [Candidatus Methylomirabilales bacterium]